MNPKPISETEAIRSDIEMTRRRMDDTVEALGDRLHGRHLVDEIIGFFRGNDRGDGAGARLRGKISESAGAATDAVVATVKRNPVPLALIAGGAAWLAYSAMRGPRADAEDEPEEDDPYDPDTHYDRPLDYSTTASSLGPTAEDMADEADSTFSQVEAEAADTTNNLKEKLHHAKERAAAMGSRVRDRAAELGGKVQDRTREAYAKTRDQVSRTANEHPLELGLGCLAIGVLVGLALPTPAPVNRLAGPTVEKLRNRTRTAGRDVVEKGKRVVAAASNAMKDEAQSQGLTFDRLRQSGEAIADGAGASAVATAREEGRAGEDRSQDSGPAADPSTARPVM